MIEITEEFGLNAGRVWRALDAYGPLTEIQLIEETGLREKEIYAAIGWLARENKISRNEGLYWLSETNLNSEIGENAGRIWDALDKEGCLDRDVLLEKTRLSDDDLFTGVGWLARENKIAREGEVCFKLDTSNLDSEIGSHAGRVWKILDIWGDADFTTIKRLSNLDDNQVHSALGWLAREDKIEVNENQRYNLK